MAELRVYRTYRYIDKNPVIDRVRTLVQDEGLFKKLGIVHEISGVATSTLNNWFHGETKNPQHGTIAAVITSLGYREEFIRDHDIDIEKERKVAADWLERQGKNNKIKKKKRTNGHAKKGK
jgi:transcriptional regulator with XRE-family HTH domain